MEEISRAEFEPDCNKSFMLLLLGIGSAIAIRLWISRMLEPTQR